MSKIIEQIENKNSLFQEIYESIKSKEDKTFICKIIEEKKDKYLNKTFLSMDSKNEISHRFIRNLDEINLIDNDICFKTSNISLTLLNRIPYFYIEKFEIVKNEKKSFYDFEQIKIYDSFDKIDNNNNDLCFLILKAKEIYKSLTDEFFIFEDLTGKTINVEENGYNFEHGKIYIFKGYIYNKNKNIFETTLVSSIEEYSTCIDKIYNIKELKEIKEGMLVNFKSKIKSFNIKDTFLKIEDESSNKYKVNVNYHLLKKISVDQECTFSNFTKINYNEFSFTNLSNIEYGEEETFVEFNFSNCENLKTGFYNNIKIDGDDYLHKIDKPIIKIKINETSRRNLFLKKISFVRVENNTLTNSLDYLYELNKGKVNHIESFLGKGGFFYEFYIKSIKKEDLPKQLSVKIGKKTINFKNPDKFSNEFQERFILANIPEQNVNTIFDSSNKKIKSKSGKYLILIKDKNDIKDERVKNKIIIEFIKEKNDIIKKDFIVPEIVSNEMKKLYNNYINEKDFMIKYLSENDKFPNLNDKNMNIQIEKLLDIMFYGFKQYNFNNSKKDFNNIKYLSFIFICHYLNKAKGYGFLVKRNFEIILKSIIKLDYIDRIKVLITFTANYYENLFEKKYVKIKNKVKKQSMGPIEDFLVLVNIDDNTIIEKYEYIKTAFDILYKIIDQLTEECALFKIIQQINSLIHINASNKKKIHSGSILNLNDIKLELIRNLNRFIIISQKERKYLDNYAFFRDISLSVTINIKTIISNFLDNTNSDLNNLATVILFLLIHESLGHKKKNINNEDTDTPREYYGINFEELILNTSDSGLILENIIFGKVFEPKYLMKNKDAQLFLNEKLYLEKNFESLHKLYSKLEDNVKLNEITEEEEEEEEVKYSKKSKINKSGKKMTRTNSDEDTEEYPLYPLLYHDLLAKFGVMTEEQIKENQDNLDYQLFLLMYEDKKQKERYGLKYLK